MTGPAPLRARAEALAAPLPPLLAEAEHLAASVLPGGHGRRRAGMGEEFWQYRPAQPGEEARLIDWRRSARSDQHFVRDREWLAAQSVTLWADDGQSMAFSGDRNRPAKGDRARLLALALAALLLRGGERVGLAGEPPASGQAQLLHLAHRLSAPYSPADHAAPGRGGLPAHSRALYLSDFLGDLSGLEVALDAAARRGVKGVLVQVLDPQEEAFPFGGRVIFESVSGALRHETQNAGDLRARYLARLAARKDRLAALARQAGWHYHCHHTAAPALGALLWIYAALEGGR